MEMDSSHIFSLAMCDSRFEGILKKLTHEDVKQAVIDAFDFLYIAHSPDEEEWQAYLSTRGCMVIFLLQHLFVRLLTKKLMNLMTAEALILNCDKIPSTYLENYLENQSHFSLKEAITSYHTALEATIK